VAEEMHVDVEVAATEEVAMVLAKAEAATAVAARAGMKAVAEMA
jgi:hypothetical protein